MVQLAIRAAIDITSELNCDEEVCMRLIFVLRIMCIKIIGMMIALKTRVSITIKLISTG
jgi:hypothetical protein